MAAAFAASTAFAAQLRLDPPCPTPSSPSLLVATSPVGGPAYVESMSMSLVDASTLKVVYRAVPDPGGVVPVVTQASMPALPPGDYHLQAYYRLNVNGFLDPEIVAESLDFRVEPSAQTGCHPWTVTTQGATIQDAVVGTPFAPLSVVVKDDHNSPVQGAHVHFQRIGAPGGADATLSDSVAITDLQGRATVNATANGEEGSYTYAAYVTHANVTASGYFTLRNRTASTPSGLPAVVEYFNAERSHYFMTSNPQEMQLLDDGTMKGWTRTGVVFSAFPDGTPSASPVCRLYGKPEAGLDSHFYSASPAECSETLARLPDAWILETDRAFNAVLPNTTTGECTTGVPLYRVFNDRPDANHRYLTTKEGVEAMVALGWVREGYGPDAVAMCVAA